jgi:Tol biopolymer transport system component
VITGGAVSQLTVADADGGNALPLIGGAHAGQRPSWSPDSSRLAFSYSPKGDRWQAMVIDVDGTKLKPVDPEEKRGTLHPKFGADGRVAYLVPSGRIGKLEPSELVVSDGKTRQVIANAFVTDFAWSPDGKQIAYSRLGTLVFHDLVSGKTKGVDYPKIHPELRSHTAWQIQWRPDGQSVVCGIMFLGGRRQGTHIKGDDELYVITPDGKATELTPPQRATEWQWVKEQPPAK